MEQLWNSVYISWVPDIQENFSASHCGKVSVISYTYTYSPLAYWVECLPMARRLGFNPRLSHTKDSKMVLDTSLLNTQHYKVQIKGKWSNPGKGVAPSPTPWCNSYWKASLWVAFNYSQPTLYIYILLLPIIRGQ